jgi:TROVE domain
VAKFSNARVRPRSAIRTTGAAQTHEGGQAFSRNPESDLFLLAISNMVGEDTFYESAAERDQRFAGLVQQVTRSNPEFIAGSDSRIGFARYLRETMLMRSASLVLAAEYVAAGGDHGRRVINAALQRPDEPAEFLGYWLTNHGRRLPAAVKRGLADAVGRLYTQASALKYDSANHAVRMGDVIELVHPAPVSREQADLFRYLIDVRHNRSNPRMPELGAIRTEAELRKLPEAMRRGYAKMHPDVLARAGYTWERLSSWLPGGMDAEAWEIAIPQMRPMALVRNLRNFDQAQISEDAIDAVIREITDAEHVKRARLFPYQVWSAYKHAPSDNWKRALGKTFALATDNVPTLDGSLVLVDTSGSMQMGVSGRSKIVSEEIAGVFAAALMRRSKDSNLGIFGMSSMLVDVEGLSPLQVVEKIHNLNGAVGHSTYGHSAIHNHFNPRKHKRVFLITDDQQHDSGQVDLSRVPLIYTVNLHGYAPSSLEQGPGRYSLGGFSDSSFEAVRVLEAGSAAGWPF